MKVWMSNSTRNKKRHIKSKTWLIFGSIFLAVIIIFLCVALADRLGWSMEDVSGLLVLGISAVLIFMAVRIGMAAGRDVMIFCQDDNYDMFVVNALTYIDIKRGVTGYVSMANQTQNILTQIKNDRLLEHWMAKEDSLSPVAAKILWVEKIRKNRKSHTVICQVQEPNGITRRCNYIIQDGYERQDELIMALETKVKAQYQEIKPNYNPLGIFLSAVVLVGSIVICVLSYDGNQILPSVFYYPSMLFSLVPLYSLLYFIIRQARGE